MPSSTTRGASVGGSNAGDVVADPGADRQCWREDAARECRPSRTPCWRTVCASRRRTAAPCVDCTRCARLRVARAVYASRALSEADQRQRESAAAGEQHRAVRAARRSAERTVSSSRITRANSPPPRPPTDAAQQHAEPAACASGRSACNRAEVGVVAEHAERNHAGEDHGREHDAAEAMLEGAGEFLDREHHAGQRRVERGGDAGGAAGKDEARNRLGIGEAEASAKRVHQPGADMHGRPLAPDRGAAEQPDQASAASCRSDRQRKQALPEARDLPRRARRSPAGMPLPRVALAARRWSAMRAARTRRASAPAAAAEKLRACVRSPRRRNRLPSRT